MNNPIILQILYTLLIVLNILVMVRHNKQARLPGWRAGLQGYR